jgi:hypothetical protein
MTVMIIRAALIAIGVFVSLDVGDMIRSRRGKLLEEMVHPMRGGRDEKKPECGGGTQI